MTLSMNKTIVKGKELMTLANSLQMLNCNEGSLSRKALSLRTELSIYSKIYTKFTKILCWIKLANVVTVKKVVIW